MSINYKKIANLPAMVRAFCYGHSGWIVGSGAKFLLDKQDQPRDWDILVPFWSWGVACKIVPAGTQSNSHGGFKLILSECEIDVWAGDIGWFLSQVPVYPSFAVHPQSMVFLSASDSINR